MDFDFTDGQEAFRKDVRQWLERNVPDDLRGMAFASSRGDRAAVTRLRAWQKTMYNAGYVGMDWPREFGGRGASLADQIILYQEMSRAESPQLVNRGGVSMLGPTLMKYGTAAQQKRFLPKILTADEIWCQGFSEPNAGSDLANLQTRAVREGDVFVVNGQKVWTSMAHVSEWCFLLVRTDPDAPKHKGISFLLVDMKTPGITVRPLRQMTGEAEFNEVFFDNVRVPVENLVHRLNEGWAVALTTLSYERDLLTFIRHISLRNALARLVKRVRESGRAGDPVIRQKVASLWIGEQALQMNAYRSLTRILRGGQPGPEGSTAKLSWSHLDQELAQVATEVIGPYSQIAGGPAWVVDHGQWEFYTLLAQASGIRAGTSEILRNILAERVLGLPKD
ncbi:MAG: acyl-CoA dehydrogenase family protein [Candidatus Rokubacteria bacterium]|nr:acyl-CoA dehydrogenase family protein [Candidatus Rokubacteria bacterium]MBI3826530.1 acyl-CoA dehydrogenase family protein [Candidatus Rokubacteria bacterium]